MIQPFCRAADLILSISSTMSLSLPEQNLFRHSDIGAPIGVELTVGAAQRFVRIQQDHDAVDVVGKSFRQASLPFVIRTLRPIALIAVRCCAASA